MTKDEIRAIAPKNEELALTIVISEVQIMSAMEQMCAESLDPETFEKWEDVLEVLRETRNALSRPRLPDDAYMPKICVEPDAWATTDNCVGPNLGKVRYDKLPIQSLNPLQYTHEKMYSHRSVIGLMKAAYYDGYSEREKEVRAT